MCIEASASAPLDNVVEKVVSLLLYQLNLIERFMVNACVILTNIIITLLFKINLRTFHGCEGHLLKMAIQYCFLSLTRNTSLSSFS